MNQTVKINNPYLRNYAKCLLIKMDTLKIQQRLNQIFQNKLKEDGISGPNTINQIKIFQRMEGLKDDGIVGPLTLKKLFPVMSNIANFYPELPEVQYQKTTVEMGAFIETLKSYNIPVAVKIAAYVMFRNESANGKSGINNNYLGVQADNARWPAFMDASVNGTVVLPERMTGHDRRFLSFTSFKGNIDFLIDRVTNRGLYVGGSGKYKIDNAADWVSAYWKSWVTGNANAVPPPDEKAGLLSMYGQGERVFA